MQKLVFSIVMLLVSLFINYLLAKKYKLNKNQSIIFWLLVLFWTSISIIRAYRKSYVVSPLEFGGLGSTTLIAAQITSAYGLISFIIRTPLFFMTDILQKRKIFIQFAMAFMMFCSLLVVFYPSINTLYFSSLAMGISASMLAIFNVLFSETFSKENAAVSASILSVAPLMAEFLAAPIQYLATHGAYKNFNMLWLISTIIAFITFLLSFYMKELKNNSKFSKEKVKFVISNKSFIICCFISIIVSFVKFSTSGTNMLFYSEQVLRMPPLLLAYLDTIFASSQLIASVLVGTYFKNKLGIEKTLFLSLSSLLIFYIIIIFTRNPYIAFGGYLFNGFGYGATYISLISIALQYFDVEYRNISMGIFQGFFAFGIFFGDRIYVYLSKLVNNNPTSIFVIVSSVTLMSMIVVFSKLVFKRKVLNE